MWATANGKKPSVRQLCLDVLRDEQPRQIYWNGIRNLIGDRYGLWIKATTLVRTLAKLASEGEIHSDGTGHFWW